MKYDILCEMSDRNCHKMLDVCHRVSEYYLAQHTVCWQKEFRI